VAKRVSRVVVVTRKTPLELLLQRWGTYGQAQFYLSTRGQTITMQEALHERIQEGLGQVLAALPSDQRFARVDRDDLDRFLFSPDDVVLIVGQDGLVPNVAKYLDGQLTIGLNPDPSYYDGVLCRFPPAATPALLAFAGEAAGPFEVRPLTMAVATREDGQRLFALNEIFVGHTTHQSARYKLTVGMQTERHSSSGLICATGTGSTGWARSIVEQRGITEPMPAPDEARLAWFVREPFPSLATDTSLSFGLVAEGEELVITSEMGEGGTLFADGIESDRIEFADGQTVRIRVAERRLRLVVPLATPSGKGATRAAATNMTRRSPGM
jgi:NAD kinase